MKIITGQPLIPLTDKTDPIGVVLNAIISVQTKRKENGNSVEGITKATDAKNESISQKFTNAENELLTSISGHASKRGAVHNETKESVGLGNKPNYAPGSIEEQLEGARNDLLCTSVGLKELVESKLTIDSKKYIRSRIVPIASGIGTGPVIQTPLNSSLGSLMDNFGTPTGFIGGTPFSFDTEDGITIFPSLIDGKSFTQKNPISGSRKNCVSPMGGTLVSLYNGQMELRKLRPSTIKGVGTQYRTDPLIKMTQSLFGAKSYCYYNESQQRSIRSLNKNELPFDVLNEVPDDQLIEDIGDLTPYSELFKGIFEAREELLYNLYSEFIYDDIEGTGKDIYLTLGIQVYPFTTRGYEAVEKTNSLEIKGTFSSPLVNITHNLTADGKLGSYDAGLFNDKRYFIKLSNLVNFDSTLTQLLWNRLDKDRSGLIGFDWKNKMMGTFSIRLPIAFENLTQSSYNHMYLDIGFSSTEDLENRAISFIPTFITDLSVDRQTINSDLELDKEGLFKQYSSNTKETFDHPKIMDGIFNLSGGHTKTYTFYNRQYICHYDHTLTSVNDWINNTYQIEGMNYLSQSTLPNDGFYGDHLRHVPLFIDNTNKLATYMTYTRDWNQKYRWAITKVELEEGGPTTSSTGVTSGPWRESVTWLDKTVDDVPSFVVINDTSSTTMTTWPGVFNTQNGFVSYETFTYNVEANSKGFSWSEKVVLDDSVLRHIKEINGGWSDTHIQCFNTGGTLIWVCQNLDPANTEEIDCYYGTLPVKDTYPDELLVKHVSLEDDISKATLGKTKVNQKDSLEIKTKDIIGFDAFTSTDIYMTKVHPTMDEYIVFINLAPFNNFYFEFKFIKNNNTKEVTFGPNINAIDPIFSYSEQTGFNVNYDDVVGYNKNIPHRFHLNFQTPVCLNGYTWVLRKTPGNYGVFTTKGGVTTIDNGIMNTIKGIPIFPLGSILTVSGTNTVVKNPLNARSTQFINDELYATYLGETAVLYGVNNNPYEYMGEPHSGAAPAGFIAGDGSFLHYDPNGYRNDLFPVIDGARLSIYGYGSSIPILTGKPGSGIPNNKFFLK